MQRPLDTVYFLSQWSRRICWE